VRIGVLVWLVVVAPVVLFVACVVAWKVLGNVVIPRLRTQELARLQDEVAAYSELVARLERNLTQQQAIDPFLVDPLLREITRFKTRELS